MVDVQHGADRSVRDRVGRQATGRPANWQLSLQRSFDVSCESLWAALVGGGDAGEGAAYQLHDGICGTVRRIGRQRLLELSVAHPEGPISVLELELHPRGRHRSTLQLRHHSLPSREERERFRRRWSDGLVRVSALAEGVSPAGTRPSGARSEGSEESAVIG